MLAKSIAKSSQAIFIYFSVSQVYERYLGESEKVLDAVFSLARKVQPAIIFIDEVDAMVGARGANDHEVSTRLKTMIFSLMDGLLTSSNDNVIVLACTNRRDSLDPAFLRRMQKQFEVGLPDARGREQILRLALKEEDAEPGFSYETLAEETEGFSGSDLHSLVSAAAQLVLSDATKDIWTEGGGVATQEVQFRKITLEDCLQSRPAPTRPVEQFNQFDGIFNMFRYSNERAPYNAQ